MHITFQITKAPETCRDLETVPEEEGAIKAELAAITDLVCEYKAASNEIELQYTRVARRRERLELALVHAKMRKAMTCSSQ